MATSLQWPLTCTFVPKVLLQRHSTVLIRSSIPFLGHTLSFNIPMLNYKRQKRQKRTWAREVTTTLFCTWPLVVVISHHTFSWLFSSWEMRSWRGSIPSVPSFILLLQFFSLASASRRIWISSWASLYSWRNSAKSFFRALFSPRDSHNSWERVCHRP